jgi:hypothetical protein
MELTQYSHDDETVMLESFEKFIETVRRHFGLNPSPVEPNSEIEFIPDDSTSTVEEPATIKPFGPFAVTGNRENPF